MSTQTVTQKIGGWKTAYDIVREELTPTDARALQDVVKAKEGLEAARIYVALSRIVMANDRTAAMVAALITQTGIKPVSLNAGEEDD